jgi:archaemetzincin
MNCSKAAVFGHIRQKTAVWRKYMRKLLCCLFLLCGYGLFPQELTISELEGTIAEAESRDNVNARSYIHQYWQLADLYLENEDYGNAYRIIIKGLTLDSWNYKYQKIVADIEMMNGEYEKAYSRFNFIINNLKSLALLYEDSIAQRSKIAAGDIDGQPVYIPNYYVYIATYPDLNEGVVDLLAARISEEYGIEVKIINVGVDVSDVNIRDSQLNIYDELIEDVRSRYAGEVIDRFISQIGLTEDDLDTKEGKRVFVYALLNQSEGGRRQWEEIEMAKSQYSANALLEQLSRKFGNYNNEPYCLGILGITREDIYENDYNFLFGWAFRRLGVMSYARFALGNSTREQFEKRAVMQAFSSIGLVIGIPRCTNPDCARAYPNSLEEHDRKEDKLCEDCRANLRRLYSGLKQP